jgi:hypothetical protein
MENFLKLLESDGGKILVIISLLMFIFGLLTLLILTGHPPQESGKQLAAGAVGSLLGILIQYLKPADKVKE